MIFLPSQPSWLLDELLMDKRDSNGLFSTRLVYRDSNDSYSTTDPSLILILILLDFESFLAFVTSYKKHTGCSIYSSRVV